MARGLTRDQLGVTEQMIQTYGDTVWELSHNVQIRRGDAVRLLDWEQIEAQRDGTGRADVEIAGRIGLTREQVTFIRLAQERRRFRPRSYHRLYELGGGKRFRAERFTPHDERFTFDADAMALRRALDFDPRAAARFIRAGLWRADTVDGWLAHHAAEIPGQPAIVTADGEITYAEASAQARRIAAALLGRGIGRGDVIALATADAAAFPLLYYAVAMIGGVACPLDASGRGAAAALERVRARAVICDGGTAAALSAQGVPADHIVVSSGTAPAGTQALETLIASAGEAAIETPPVASDPALVLFATDHAGRERAVIHNHHTMLSGVRAGAALFPVAPGETVLTSAPYSTAAGIWAINHALCAGAAIASGDTPARVALLVLTAGDAAAWAADGVPPGGSSPRQAVITGADCAEPVASGLEALLPGGRVGRMWCPAEAFAVLATPPKAAAALRHGTLGEPAPGAEARIVTPDGADAAPGTPGELQIRGCSVTPGYVGDAAANRTAFTGDGWLRTGLTAIDDGGIRVR